MKPLTLVIAFCTIACIVWLITTIQKDTKARKEAVKVTGIVTHIRCKQRLKSDKSAIKISYQQKEYTIFLKNEKHCDKYQLKQEVTLYYSKNYDKLFLKKDY